MPAHRIITWVLIAIAVAGLLLGLAAWAAGKAVLASGLWTVGVLPVVAALFVAIVRELMAGRLGVDAVAFVSMSAALLLGEGLAGAVVAVMYAGGNMLEDFAVARAERDLNSLVDRAPRTADASQVSSRRFPSTGWPSVTPSSCAAGRSSPSTGWSAAPRPSLTRPH